MRLPSTSLLGNTDKPSDDRISFFQNISRVAVGTIAIGSIGVPVLQVSSYIAARYSLRRTITNRDGGRLPIMSFRTQKTPVLTALAQAFVMSAFHDWAVKIFSDVSLDYGVRHALAAITKVVMVQHSTSATSELADRCGSQGLFEVNIITATHVRITRSQLMDVTKPKLAISSEITGRHAGCSYRRGRPLGRVNSSVSLLSQECIYAGD